MPGSLSHAIFSEWAMEKQGKGKILVRRIDVARGQAEVRSISE